MTNASVEVQTRELQRYLPWGLSPTYDFIHAQPFHYDTYLTYDIVHCFQFCEIGS